MNYDDIEVDNAYLITNIKRVGRNLDIQGLTLNRVYVVLRKNAPDSVLILNDVGRNVSLKAFRFQPIVAPEPVPNPWPIVQPEPDLGWLDDLDPPPKELKWEMGATVRFKPECGIPNWARDNPIRNNPGWVDPAMTGMIGKTWVIKSLLGSCVKLADDPMYFSFAKEWLVLVGNGEAIAPNPVEAKPKPKFVKGDVVVVEKIVKGGQWIAEMDATVADVIVIAGNTDNGWYVCDNGFNYPPEALRLGNEEDRKLAIGALLRKAQQDNIKEAKMKADSVSTFVKFKHLKGKVSPTNTFAGICHADLGYKDYEGGGELVGVTDYLYAYEKQVDKVQHADYKAYVDYIINRSPWAIASKRMSVDRVLKEGLHMKLSTPGKIFGAACVALRMGKEFSATRLPIYTMVVNEGYEECVAFMVMHAFTADDQEIRYSPPNGAHTLADTATQIGPWCSLMRYGYDEASLKAEPYIETQTYRGFTQQLSDQKDYLNIRECFSTFVERNCPGKKEGEGFKGRKVYTKKDVFTLSDAFTKLIHKLDVME